MEKDSVGVILAAGLGKRMQSDLPKALSLIDGKPMLEYLVNKLKQATEVKPIIVVGHKKEEIVKIFQDRVTYVTQEEQLGTAHALLVAKDACKDVKRIAVFYGDHPLVSLQTMSNLLKKSVESNAEITLATSLVENFNNENKVFQNFARILRKDDKILGIREFKEATDNEKEIREINPGYYVFRSDWLWPHLAKVQKNNSKGEYYLTDLIHLATDENLTIESIKIPPIEAMGANSKEELGIIEQVNRLFK